MEYEVWSSHNGEDGDRGRPAYTDLIPTFREDVTAGIWGTEVTMEVECIYGTVVTIYQTIWCHNPVGHSVLYGEFLSTAIDMPFYLFVFWL